MTNAISAAEPHKCDNIVARRSEESVTSCRELAVSPPQQPNAFEESRRTVSPTSEMLSKASGKQKPQSQREPRGGVNSSSNGRDKRERLSLLRLLVQQGRANAVTTAGGGARKRARKQTKRGKNEGTLRTSGRALISDLLPAAGGEH